MLDKYFSPYSIISLFLFSFPVALTGECIKILVQDPAGLPVPGALVTTISQQEKTNENGRAQLCNVALEKNQLVTVQASGFQPIEKQINTDSKEFIIRLFLSARLETPIVVTGTTEPQELSEINRNVVVLPIQNPEVPSWSFADVLKYDTSIDLRERGPEGSQADLSIRGSTFGQVLVLVNGMRVNDSQSGHHNLDLPLPFEAVSQVEILHGTGSTLYGSDAIGGAVNFVTKKPKASELKLMAGGGDFGWHRQAVVSGLKRDDWSQRTTFERNSSSGFRPGRDYRNTSFSSETFIDKNFGSTTVMLAGNQRPFGANGFYGPWDSWEKTGSTFLAASQTIGRDPSKIRHRMNFSYRRHTDNFVLFRHRPEIYENLHTTNQFHANYSIHDEVNPKVSWSAGGSLLSEDIDSTNLGLRNRERVSAFFVLNLRPTERLSLAFGVREEVWEKWRGETSPTVSLGYWLGRDFKIRGHAGHAYRIPTYTDLYYEDPVNKGNAELLPENAWNYETGVDWYPAHDTSVSMTWFQRRETNTIDWVRGVDDIKFRARNFAELTFNGAEIQFRKQLGTTSEIGFNYTSIKASKTPTPGFTSLYVFNFPLNSINFSYKGSLGKWIIFKTRLGAFNRSWQPAKILWDAALTYTNGRWRPFVQVSNLLNMYHEAFQGLSQPGRWLRCGLQLQIF